jgi:hypothetical protein
MKKAVQANSQNPQNSAAECHGRSRRADVPVSAQGPLADLAAAINQSPRVQAQLKLAQEIQAGAQMPQYTGSNAATAVQRRRPEEKKPVQAKSKLEEKKPLQGKSEDGAAPAANRSLQDQVNAGVPVNDNPGLEKEAGIMDDRAAEAIARGSIELQRTTVGPQWTIQAKKEIKGERNYEDQGKLSIHFEEREKGSAAGMYGTIAFAPSTEGTPAKKIDLVQIASLMTNEAGQQALDVKERGGKVDENIEEKNIDTSGNPAVKDVMRGTSYEGYHVDLVFDKSAPRLSTGDPEYESAYNAERRSGAWEDPLDTVRMGKPNGRVLDQYHISNETTSTRKIDQDPGFNNGKGKVKGTELFDYPVTSQPSTFSFQTAIEADREIWGTVFWGFTTLLNRKFEQIFVDEVSTPKFQKGSTDQLNETLNIFDKVLANPSAWTSPEAFQDTKARLESKDNQKKKQGHEYLVSMAKALGDTLDHIDKRARTKTIMLQFAGPHIDMAYRVQELAKHHAVENPILSELKELCDDIEQRLKE